MSRHDFQIIIEKGSKSSPYDLFIIILYSDYLRNMNFNINSLFGRLVFGLFFLKIPKLWFY